MQLQQQEKPLKQQLRTILWQNGGISINPPLEMLPETLDDPQSLVWLDIEGDCSLFNLNNYYCRVGEYKSKLCFFLLIQYNFPFILDLM
jgi:hypothetical protein